MERRLTRVEKQLGAGDADYGPILWIDTRQWPLADQAAFRTGSPEQQADLIERHCGRRPAITGPHGPIRTVIDVGPPPSDPAHATAEAEWILGARSE